VASWPRFALLLISTRAAPSTDTTTANCARELRNERRCEFSLGVQRVSIDERGSRARISDDRHAQPFDLAVAPNAVQALYVAEYRSDLLLVVSLSDGLNRNGLVIRIDSSLRPKWRARFEGFNLSPGTIESRYLYQAGVGFMGKMDLDTGKFLWKYERLYWHKRPHFNSFKQPEVRSADVVFVEKLPNYFGHNQSRMIVVSKASGKIRGQPDIVLEPELEPE